MSARPAVVVLLAAGAAVLALPLAFLMLFLATTPGTSASPAASAPASAVAAPGPIAAGADAAVNESIGAMQAASYGWTGKAAEGQPSQVTCLDDLWTRESSWQATAKNPTSGAYGISQALGHLDGEDQGATPAQVTLNQEGDNFPSAYASANPPPWGTSSASAQIAWGLSYIRSSYGTPCQAWNHETSAGWY